MSSRQVRVTEAEQFNPGRILGVMIEVKDILLANINGVSYTIDNKFSHKQALLYNGAFKQ